MSQEDLLMGASITYDIEVPPEVLNPGKNQAGSSNGQKSFVQIRPLSIGKFQLIMKAAREDAGLIPLLMVKESLVEPKLSLDQIKNAHLGLIDFLMMHISRVSGLTEKKSF